MLRLHIKPNIDMLDTDTRKRYGLVFANLARQAWGLEGGYDQSASMRFHLLQSLPDCEATLEEMSIEPATRSLLAYHLAKPYERMGQIQHALRLYEASLKTDQELGDVRGIAVTQHAMADLLRQQGQVGEAMRLYEASLKTKQELGDVREIAVTQTNFGHLLWQQGEYIQALTRVWSAYKSLPENDFPLDVQGIRGILVWFKQHFSGEEQQFDALWLQATAEPQPAWLLVVQVGSSVELLETHLAILRACKTDGIEATFTRLKAMQEGT